VRAPRSGRLAKRLQLRWSGWALCLFALSLRLFVNSFGARRREGVPGDSVVLILQGQAVSYCAHAKDGGKIEVDELGQPQGHLVGRGSAFGMHAVVTQMPRQESIQAITDCEVLMVPRDGIWRPKRLAEELSATVAWHELQKSVVAALLLRINFFKTLVTSKRHSLSGLMQVQTFDAGELIFREGAESDRFFIFVDGCIDMTIKSGKVLCRYTPEIMRPWFGELGVWLNRPRSCAAVAVEASRVLFVEQAQFDHFLSLVPNLRKRLKVETAEMLANESRQYLQASVVPASPIKGPLQELPGDKSLFAVIDTTSGLLPGKRSGGGDKAKGEERSVNVDRWERLVSSVLAEKNKAEALLGRKTGNVSFRARDFKWRGPRSNVSRASGE